MLHLVRLVESVDAASVEKGSPLLEGGTLVSAREESPVQMKRRIEELLLLAEFNAAIGTVNDPKQVCEAACRWLEEVLKWEVLSVSTTEGAAGQFRYQVLHLDEHLSEICPDLVAEVTPSLTRGGKRDMGWSEFGNNTISVCFPDRSGVLSVSRRSLAQSQYSDELLSAVAETLSRALSNAREYAKLKTLSMRDHLTGLYNRRVFEAMLEVEVQKRTPNPFSLLLIDLDNFKEINDSYGHGTGDEVLVYVAEMLRLNFRKADIAARYGGDEFSVLLPGTSLSSAQMVAERFRASVAAQPSAFGPQKIIPTVSVGIATVSDRAKIDIARVVEQADRALYQAKAPGKNRVCAAEV